MNNQNENLEELFERFGEAAQAGQACDDIRHGDSIFANNPAPKPDEKLIAAIKADIAGKITRRHARSYRKVVFRTAVTAAAVFVVVWVGAKLFEKPIVREGSVDIVAIEDEGFLTGYDQQLDEFETELDQIEDDLFAMQPREKIGNGQINIDELETEFSEIENDFWKG